MFNRLNKDKNETSMIDLNTQGYDYNSLNVNKI